MPKKAIALHNALLGEFGPKLAVDIVAPPRGKAGAFEVTVDGKLVHSKLKLGHGKAETEEELDALLDHINAELRKRAESRKQPPSRSGDYPA